MQQEADVVQVQLSVSAQAIVCLLNAEPLSRCKYQVLKQFLKTNSVVHTDCPVIVKCFDYDVHKAKAANLLARNCADFGADTLAAMLRDSSFAETRMELLKKVVPHLRGQVSSSEYLCMELGLVFASERDITKNIISGVYDEDDSDSDDAEDVRPMSWIGAELQYNWPIGEKFIYQYAERYSCNNLHIGLSSELELVILGQQETSTHIKMIVHKLVVDIPPLVSAQDIDLTPLFPNGIHVQLDNKGRFTTAHTVIMQYDEQQQTAAVKITELDTGASFLGAEWDMHSQSFTLHSTEKHSRNSLNAPIEITLNIPPQSSPMTNNSERKQMRQYCLPPDQGQGSSLHCVEILPCVLWKFVQLPNGNWNPGRHIQTTIEHTPFQLQTSMKAPQQTHGNWRYKVLLQYRTSALLSSFDVDESVNEDKPFESRPATVSNTGGGNVTVNATTTFDRLAGYLMSAEGRIHCSGGCSRTFNLHCIHQPTMPVSAKSKETLLDQPEADPNRYKNNQATDTRMRRVGHGLGGSSDTAATVQKKTKHGGLTNKTTTQPDKPTQDTNRMSSSHVKFTGSLWLKHSDKKRGHLFSSRNKDDLFDKHTFQLLGNTLSYQTGGKTFHSKKTHIIILSDTTEIIELQVSQASPTEESNISYKHPSESPYAFSLSDANSERPFVLAAETKGEYDTWLQYLRLVCKKDTFEW